MTRASRISLFEEKKIEMILSLLVIIVLLESFPLLHGELICLDSTIVPFYAFTVLLFNCIDNLTAIYVMPFLIRR